MNGWRMMGIFFGYPDCCIEAFTELRHLEDSSRETRPLMGTGYVCCEKCRSRTPEQLVEVIERRRVCTIPFPGAGKDKQMAKEFDGWAADIERQISRDSDWTEMEIEQFETVLLVFGTDPEPHTSVGTSTYFDWAEPIRLFLSERWGIEDSDDSGGAPCHAWMRRYNTWCAMRLGIPSPAEVEVKQP